MSRVLTSHRSELEAHPLGAQGCPSPARCSAEEGSSKSEVATRPLSDLDSGLELGVPGVAFAAGRTDVVGVLAASRVVGGPQATVEVAVELGGGDDDIVAKRLTDEVRGVLEGKGVAMTDGYEQSRVDDILRWDADDNHELVELPDAWVRSTLESHWR